MKFLVLIIGFFLATAGNVYSQDDTNIATMKIVKPSKLQPQPAPPKKNKDNDMATMFGLYFENYHPLISHSQLNYGGGLGLRFMDLIGLWRKTGIAAYSQVGLEGFSINNERGCKNIPVQFGADYSIPHVGFHAEFGPSFFMHSNTPLYSNTTIFEYGGGISTGFRLKLWGNYADLLFIFYVKDIGGQLMTSYETSIMLGFVTKRGQIRSFF